MVALAENDRYPAGGPEAKWGRIWSYGTVPSVLGFGGQTTKRQ
jgi:hypothetical protein